MVYQLNPPIIPKALEIQWSKYMEDEEENEFPGQSGNGIEREVRFGYFDSGFMGQLPDPSLYHQVKQRLDRFANRHPKKVIRTESQYLVQADQGLRRIEKDGIVSYQDKIRLETYDNYDWGIRFSKSKEILVPEPQYFNPKVTREIERISYLDTRVKSNFYGFRIDLSRVVGSNQHYELELEVVDPNQAKSIRKWVRVIKTLYGWALDAISEYQIIPLSERIFISQLVNRVLINQNRIELDHRLVNRPTTLMNVLDIDQKAVSLKLDGVHKIIISDEYGVYACSSPFSIQKIGPPNSSQINIIECEYLKEQHTFYSFDILTYRDLPVTDAPLDERREHLERLIPELELYKPYQLVSKPIYYPGDSQKLSIDLAKNTLPIDGLIFQSLTDYNQKIFKWKSSSKLTIDFLLKRGGVDYWNPYVWDKGHLVPLNETVIGFGEDYHYKIVECKWCPLIEAWLPVRVRIDRDLPNYLNTANIIIEMLRHPITFEHICEKLAI